jgi:hypothetical protein
MLEFYDAAINLLKQMEMFLVTTERILFLLSLQFNGEIGCKIFIK